MRGRHGRYASSTQEVCRSGADILTIRFDEKGAEDTGWTPHNRGLSESSALTLDWNDASIRIVEKQGKNASAIDMYRGEPG